MIMLQRLARFFRLRHGYDNPIERRQAFALMAISTIISLVFLAWIVVYALSEGDLGDPIVLIAMFGAPIISGLVIFLIQTGRLHIASWIFVLFLTLTTATEITKGLDGSVAAAPMIALAAAGLLLGRRGIIITFLLIMPFVINGALVQGQATEAVEIVRADNVIFTFSAVVAIYFLVAVILYGFGGNIRNAITRAIDQIDQTKRIAELGSDASLDNDNKIYARAIDLLRDQMGYIFAQTYLADADNRLVRRLRTGVAIGDENLVIEVDVNEASALQNAASLRETIIVNRFDREIRRVHLLPSVTYGIAVPILSGDTVLAVLDVQTNNPQVTEDEIAILNALAAQIGSLLRTHQRVTSLQNDLAEQSALIDSMRRQLRLARQAESLQSNEWNTYLAGRRQDAIGFDLQRSDVAQQMIPAADLPAELKRVIEAGEVSVTEEDGAYLMCVPVILDETVIGAMAFTLPTKPDEQRIAMAGSVAQRLALALENKRLYEQSRALADRERKASDAASLLITATDVDTVLNIAADNFNRVLGAVRTRIQLDPAAVRTDSASSLSADSSPALEKKGNSTS